MQARAVVKAFSIEQIVPYFQPIFDLENHKVARYECLTRLINNNDSIYLPCEFLDIVGEEHSNTRLTQRMFELGCAYCTGRNMRWSLNIVTDSFNDLSLITWMQKLFSNTQNELVGVELCYDSVKQSPHILHNLIKRLPNLHVTIDNVSDADAELKQLLAAGAHSIKISGNLVTEYVRTNKHHETISRIIEICQCANKELVAEQIEDDNTLQAIHELGIKYGQGFYLSQTEGQRSSLKHL